MEVTIDTLDFNLEHAQSVSFLNDTIAAFAEALQKFEQGELNIKELKQEALAAVELNVRKHIRKVSKR